MAGGLRDLDRDVQFDEQLSELGGPGLAGELGQPGQFPEVVGGAQAVPGWSYWRSMTRPSWIAMPRKIGRVPAASIAARPRLRSSWNSVQVSLQAAQPCRPLADPLTSLVNATLRSCPPAAQSALGSGPQAARHPPPVSNVQAPYARCGSRLLRQPRPSYEWRPAVCPPTPRVVAVAHCVWQRTADAYAAFLWQDGQPAQLVFGKSGQTLQRHAAREAT